MRPSCSDVQQWPAEGASPTSRGFDGSERSVIPRINSSYDALNRGIGNITRRVNALSSFTKSPDVRSLICSARLRNFSVESVGKHRRRPKGVKCEDPFPGAIFAEMKAGRLLRGGRPQPRFPSTTFALYFIRLVLLFASRIPPHSLPASWHTLNNRGNDVITADGRGEFGSWAKRNNTWKTKLTKQ
jgi:hypothetical protein